MNIDLDKINPFDLPAVPIARRRQLPTEPCVYFAIDGQGTIQYVGRSTNLRQRWAGHHRYDQLSKLKGIRIAYLAVDVSSLAQAETALIKRLKPVLNRTQIESLCVELLSNDFYRKWGKLWAYAKGRSLSQLVRDVFETQVEENLPEIERMVRNIAMQRGVSFEELVEEILSGKENPEAAELRDRKTEMLNLLDAMTPEGIEEAIRLLQQLKN